MSDTALATQPQLLPGWMWLSWDWAQAELYMLCLFSQDTVLRDALYSKDVHRYVIFRMYGKPMEDVTEQERDLAKIISYALIYSGFDFDSTISNVVKKAPWLTREQVVAALQKYVEEFHMLFDWTGRALLDWYDAEGNVAYLYGQRKKILFPDYLKREDGPLRRNTQGRVAINTYGQNSVGLLLKMFLAKLRADAYLHQNTRQHIPLFDAHSCQVKTTEVLGVQRQLHHLATPILRLNGFEIRMKADWKASLTSWGDLKKIPVPAGVDQINPWVLEWSAEPLAVAPPEAIQDADLEHNPFNPFVSQ